MEHFIIINDWKDCYEGDVTILGVEHSLEEAKHIFQKELIEEKKRAKNRDWDIVEETDVCFIAECEEEWSGNYTKLYIQKSIKGDD